MRPHLLVRTVGGCIRPNLDLELWTTRALDIGAERRCSRCAEGILLENACCRSHAIALLEVFCRDEAAVIQLERAGVRHSALIVARLDTVKRMLLDQVLLV